MKANIDVRSFGGSISVSPDGEIEVSRKNEDFSVYLRECRDKRIKKLSIHLLNRLSIDINHEDWQISIQEDVWDTKALIVQRLRESKTGIERQYLSKTCEWLPKKSIGRRLPDDAMRIPIFTSEKIRV